MSSCFRTAAAFVFASVSLIAAAAPSSRYTMEALTELSCEQAGVRVNEGLQVKDGDALFAAGQMYDEGWCVEREPARVAPLWQGAADAGNAEAAAALAFKMGRGDGVPQDYTAAGALLKKAGVRVGGTEIADDYSRGYAYTWLRATQIELRQIKELAQSGAAGTAQVEFDVRRGVAEVSTFRRTDGVEPMTGTRIDPTRGIVRRTIAQAASSASGKLGKPAAERLADVRFTEQFAIAPGADYESERVRRGNTSIDRALTNGRGVLK